MRRGVANWPWGVLVIPCLVCSIVAHSVWASVDPSPGGWWVGAALIVLITVLSAAIVWILAFACFAYMFMYSRR